MKGETHTAIGLESELLQAFVKLRFIREVDADSNGVRYAPEAAVVVGV